jgi:hypothetical protein
MQGAAKAAGAGEAAPAAGGEGKPLSKLEQARRQGAAKAAGAATAQTETATAPSEPAVAEAPKPAPAAPKTSDGGKPLSKLELARQQGAFKGGK